jgi:hypothetical protein
MSTHQFLLVLAKSITCLSQTIIYIYVEIKYKNVFFILIIFHPKTMFFVIMVALNLSNAINGILIAYVTYD